MLVPHRYKVKGTITKALDSLTAEQVMVLLRRANERGTTVVVVTHDNEIAAKCDRIINIIDGEVFV